MERIQTREMNLNNQYKARVAEYHEIQEKLTEVSKRYDESNEAVLEQQNRLTLITDELETIRCAARLPRGDFHSAQALRGCKRFPSFPHVTSMPAHIRVAP